MHKILKCANTKIEIVYHFICVGHISINSDTPMFNSLRIFCCESFSNMFSCISRSLKAQSTENLTLLYCRKSDRLFNISSEMFILFSNFLDYQTINGSFLRVGFIIFLLSCLYLFKNVSKVASTVSPKSYFL